MVLTEMIKVSTETKELLDVLKIVPNETYDNIIKRLIEVDKNANS